MLAAARCAGSIAARSVASHSVCSKCSVRPRRPTLRHTAHPTTAPVCTNATAAAARHPNATTPAATGAANAVRWTATKRRVRSGASVCKAARA